MRKKVFQISDMFWRIGLILWAIAIVAPLLFIILQSTKTTTEFFLGIWALPKKIHLQNFATAWNLLGIGKSLLNTLYYVGVSLFVGLFITAINAYALTRIQWKGRKLLWGAIMLSLFLPQINALIPEYVLMRSLGLTESLEGLIIISSIGHNAFNLMLLGGFMQTIPKELEESADMDGASIFKIFTRVIIPLSIPGLVTVGIFRFIGLYNNFIGPYVYLSGSPEKWTIGIAMYMANAKMTYINNWPALCAGVLISIIPTLIVYMIFQNRIVEGATLGSVKG
ncbi:MAG: carbohydrate ABC transporter permease [Eubacteriales bacterium]|nr:carbohydrate ABC transporter permease [Eubacteriales bacterium]